MDVALLFKNQIIDPEVNKDVVISDSGKRGKQLIIESVSASNAGEYTCVASNIAGSTTRSAVLQVNGSFFLSQYLKVTRTALA